MVRLIAARMVENIRCIEVDLSFSSNQSLKDAASAVEYALSGRLPSCSITYPMFLSAAVKSCALFPAPFNRQYFFKVSDN